MPNTATYNAANCDEPNHDPQHLGQALDAVMVSKAHFAERRDKLERHLQIEYGGDANGTKKAHEQRLPQAAAPAAAVVPLADLWNIPVRGEHKR